MMRGWGLLLLTVLWPTAQALGQQATAAHEAARADMLGRQLDDLLTSLHGDWGNMDQFFFQQRLGVDAQAQRELLHVSLVPAEADGPDAATPGSPPRSHLRILSGGASPQQLDERILEHQADYARAGLVSWLRSLDGGAHDCRIDWQREGGHYTGRQTGSQCPGWGSRVGDAETSLTLMLSQDDLWIAGSRAPAVTIAQRYVNELRLRRAYLFTCRINVIAAGSGQMDFGQLRVQRFDTWTDLRVHDQGGEVWIQTDEIPARRLGLRLHHVVWPFGDSEPSRGLFLLDADAPDDGRGIAYASSSPDSVRLALSNRAISASCFKDMPRVSQ